MKSAAAAAQVAATAALDAARRAAEAAAGCRPPSGAVGWPPRSPWLAAIPQPGWAASRVRPRPGHRDAPHPGRVGRRGALGVAGHPDRAGIGLPDRRRPRELDAGCAPISASWTAKVTTASRGRQSHRLRLDPHAVVDRAVRAECERTVTIRPAPDTMAYVTALLPMPGVAVYAELQPHRRHLRRRPRTRAGDGRHPGRAGHRPPRRDPDAGRGGPGASPTRRCSAGTHRRPVPGYGPIPAAIACRLVRRAVTDPRSRPPCAASTSHPDTGALVAMESRARRSRQGSRGSSRCATTPAAPRTAMPRSATPTTPPPTPTAALPPHSTAGAPARRATTPKKPPAGRSPPPTTTAPHTADYTTPTGACHHSQAPPLLNDVVVVKASAVEARIAHHLAGLAAA